ncbi:MAG: aromatic acid exporter family protein, partial [Acholeplasmataceae bacterium]|nr:aromatic acid exporter family protein [Acholeplasmataceae bacterium]
MRLLNTAIKMSLVCLIASLIARFLSLDYWITAGLLALLSIQLTRKDSMTVAIKRLVDAFFGLFLATILFIAFGYNFVVFSAFVLIFAYISWVMKMPEGIVPTLVLVTHLFNEGSFSFALLINAIALMVIAIGVALLFNLFYPASGEKEFRGYIRSIDQLLKDHLYMFSLLLRDTVNTADYQIHYNMLNKKINDAIDEAKLIDKDILFANDHRYLSYLEMRKEQINYVSHMYQHAMKIEYPHPFTTQIALFVQDLSMDIGLFNKAKDQINKLTEVRNNYKTSELPQTREAFETRAMLYQ